MCSRWNLLHRIPPCIFKNIFCIARNGFYSRILSFQLYLSFYYFQMRYCARMFLHGAFPILVHYLLLLCLTSLWLAFWLSPCALGYIFGQVSLCSTNFAGVLFLFFRHSEDIEEEKDCPKGWLFEQDSYQLMLLARFLPVLSLGWRHEFLLPVLPKLHLKHIYLFCIFVLYFYLPRIFWPNCFWRATF